MTGVRSVLDEAIYRSTVRRWYRVGYLLGTTVVSVLLFAMGRRLSH